jgi:hypothetical protein
MSFFYNSYDFKPEKNYLIYFRGCFCPPSAGHFSLLEKYIHQPNVKYLVSQMGSEKRHGVPYHFNRKIWKIYIKELLSEYRDRIYLEKLKSSSDVFNFLDGIDTVIFLRGKEDNNIKAKERERLETYGDLIRKLKKRNVEMDFLTIDRPEAAKLSSTKLIESLRKNRSYSHLKYFFPSNLSYDKTMYIVTRLKKYHLH